MASRAKHSSIIRRISRATLSAVRDVLPGGRVARPVMIDNLEPRTLFATLTVLLTEGNDTAYIESDSGQYKITANGGAPFHASVLDTTIIFRGFGGHDLLQIEDVRFGTTIQFEGGNGDDTLEVGHGNFGASVDGEVAFFGENGTDHLSINDLNGTGNDMHIGETYIYADETATFDGRIDHFVETKSITRSDNSETMFIDQPPTGWTMSLRGGNDTVHFGGPNHQLNGFIPPMSIHAGAGTDRITFDDRDGNTGVVRDYTADATTFMNQTLTQAENVELYVRDNLGIAAQVELDGFANIQNSLLLVGPRSGVVTVGDAIAPLDLNNLNLTVNAEFQSLASFTLREQDADGSGQPWGMNATATQQRLAKGNFFLNIDANEMDLHVQSGSTNDLLTVSSTHPDAFITFAGGAGNDTVAPASGTPGDDLDAIFVCDHFFFGGGGGTDFFELDDSQDQTNDGDTFYQVIDNVGSVSNRLVKSLSSGGSAVDIATWGDDVEQILVVGDGSGNRIEISCELGQALTVSGGGGDDLITNARQATGTGTISDLEGNATIIGGPGADSFLVSDRIPPIAAATEYSLTSTTFGLFASVNRFFNYETIENFQLDQSDNSTLTQLLSKPTTMSVAVNGFGGNDEIRVGGGDFDSNGWQFTNLLGGAGNDRIVIDDRNDPYDSNPIETMSVRPSDVQKGGARVDFDEFERQTIHAAGGTGGPAFPSTVSLIGTLHTLSEISVLGSAARRFDLNINDNNALGGDNYTFTSGLMTKPGQNIALTYSNAASVALTANTDPNVITVNSTDTVLTLNGNNGDDLFLIGGGNIDANLTASVVVNGEGGNDRVEFDNTQDPSSESATVASGLLSQTFTDGAMHSYAAETFRYRAGPGGGVVNMNLVSGPLHELFGGLGADTFNIGNGNIDTSLLGQIDINGVSTGDTITIDDRLDNNEAGGIDSYRFFGDVGNPNANRFQKTRAAGGMSPTVNVPGVHINPPHVILQADNSNSNITVDDYARQLSIFGNGGNDVITLNDPILPVNVDTGADGSPFFAPNADKLLVNPNFAIPAQARLLVNDSIAELTVGDSGRLEIPPEVTMRTTSGLTLFGTIDLAGAMLVSFGAAMPDTLVNWIKTGRNSGFWNGTSPVGAIQSQRAAASGLSDSIGYGSTAGFGQPSPLGVTSIGGFPISFNQTLLRYTLDGDADLNHAVNIDDFARLATNFNTTAATWVKGDFDYNSTVNIDDFGKLAQNFNGAVAGPVAQPVDPSGAQNPFGERKIGVWESLEGSA